MSTVDWFSPTERPTIAAASTNAHHSRRFHNSLRSPLRGGPFRAENGGPVAC